MWKYRALHDYLGYKRLSVGRKDPGSLLFFANEIYRICKGAKSVLRSRVLFPRREASHEKQKRRRLSRSRHGIIQQIDIFFCSGGSPQEESG